MSIQGNCLSLFACPKSIRHLSP